LGKILDYIVKCASKQYLKFVRKRRIHRIYDDKHKEIGFVAAWKCSPNLGESLNLTDCIGAQSISSEILNIRHLNLLRNCSASEIKHLDRCPKFNRFRFCT